MEGMAVEVLREHLKTMEMSHIFCGGADMREYVC